MKRAKHAKQFKGRFIMVEHLMMDSPAFQDLSGEAVKVLLFLCKKHNGENNGAIGFTVREAAKVTGTKNNNTGGKRLQELADHGFIVSTFKGAYNIKDRKASLWRITFLPAPGGQPPTRDYARWAPAEKQNTVSPSDTDGNTREYRAPENQAKKPPTVSLGDTVKGDAQRATVTPRDTLIDVSHRQAVSGGAR